MQEKLDSVSYRSQLAGRRYAGEIGEPRSAASNQIGEAPVQPPLARLESPVKLLPYIGDESAAAMPNPARVEAAAAAPNPV